MKTSNFSLHSLSQYVIYNDYLSHFVVNLRYISTGKANAPKHVQVGAAGCWSLNKQTDSPTPSFCAVFLLPGRRNKNISIYALIFIMLCALKQ